MEKIQTAFGFPTEIMDPLKSVKVGANVSSRIREVGPEISVALGLALRGFDE